MMASSEEGLFFVTTLFLSLINSCSLSNQVPLQNRFGTFNFDEMEDLYSVAFAMKPTVASLKSDQSSQEESSEESSASFTPKALNSHVEMLSSHGQKYLCSIPGHRNEKSSSISDGTVENFPNVSNILRVLEDRPCMIKTKGWWTYEYCHGRFLREYHLEAGHLVGKTIYLGFYANETEWNKETLSDIKSTVNSMKGNLGYSRLPVVHHSVFLVNGTTCDVTGKSRRAIAKVMCSMSGEDRLYDVQERDTCSYIAYIHTPLLCNVPLFSIVQHGRKNAIECSPLVSEEGYQNYLKKRKELCSVVEESREEQHFDLEKIEKGQEVSESENEDEDSMSKKEFEQLWNWAFGIARDERTLLLDRLTRKLQPGLNLEDRQRMVNILKEKSKRLDIEELRKLVENISDGGVKKEGSRDRLVLEENLDDVQELMEELDMDEESLANFEREVTAELKEKLSELGLPSEGTEVKLKVIRLSDLSDIEDELTEEEESGNSGSENPDTIKVVKMSISKLLSENSEDTRETSVASKERETKERKEALSLEANYNTVWEEENSNQRRKKSIQ